MSTSSSCTPVQLGNCRFTGNQKGYLSRCAVLRGNHSLVFSRHGEIRVVKVHRLISRTLVFFLFRIAPLHPAPKYVTRINFKIEVLSGLRAPVFRNDTRDEVSVNSQQGFHLQLRSQKSKDNSPPSGHERWTREASAFAKARRKFPLERKRKSC